MRKAWHEQLGREVLYGETPWGFHLSEDRTHLLPDARERRITAVVRHMHVQGLTIRRIIEELTALGLRTRRGGRFSVHRVFEMLQGAAKASSPHGKRRGPLRPN